MKFVITLFAITAMLLLASLFGNVNAAEIHKNGFGGITPLNTTGLTVFNDSQKRSFEYESDSLVLSAEFSILETSGDIKDFSLFDNDLTIQNATQSIEPFFVDSTFRTALETLNVIDNATFSPTDDTYAREDTPDSINGAQTVMNVASWSSSALNRRSFVQYDVSTIPVGAVVTFAEIVWERQTSGGSFPRNYDAQRVTVSWDESTLTWNNQPATAGTNYTTVVSSGSNPDSWTITDIVEGWHNGTFTNYGVRVRDDTENSGSLVHKQYYTKEFSPGGPEPVLEVTWITLNQWAEAPHSETLDMETTNVSMVWWGQIIDKKLQYVTGKSCSTSPFVYGLYLNGDSEIGARVSNSACSSEVIPTNLPINGLSLEQTYGIGIVFEDTPSGTEIHFWLDGEWIYKQTSIYRVGDTDSVYYLGRSGDETPENFCNCTHDEILVFKERLSNDTMKLLTTKQHDIVIRSGPGTTTQGFGSLLFALPWLIVFGLLGWLFYVIFLAWKEQFTKE